MHSRILLVPLVWALTPHLAAQNPFAGNAAEAEAGRGLFRIMCGPCHGIKAQGGRGPDLTLGVYNAGSTDRDLYRVIAAGVSGTEMPGYGVRIGEENVWRLVTYIRSVANRRETPATGNAAEGEKLYWGKGGCASCHRIGQRGGTMGPDLTIVGRKRSLDYLRASLTKPNADLTTGFYTITVVTKQGRKLQGVQRGFDNFTVQLVTTDGKLHSFQRDDLTSAERSYTSLMPAYNWNDTMLNDMVAWLASLRGEAKQ